MDISERKRGDRQKLARLIARESNAMQRDRLRSVLLVLQGRQTREGSAAVGHAVSRREPATIQAFLDAAASTLRRHEHAVMIFDGAGWQSAHTLRWPRRVTPLFLPPHSPARNPVERLWHWLREHPWSNRTYADEQALVEDVIRSHRTLRGKAPIDLQNPVDHA